ncbi:hypothetical protein Vadar_009393 [Vaccinium darrowii]|uniref:Uncharacterized protein n=1 Tax=Vaccinium darrowii TaxID=229202 RepID=A0ACB7Y5S3_9ERIC|nr:hypothetical protein Vadar_009393 [Vaccinium darrowii]
MPWPPPSKSNEDHQLRQRLEQDPKYSHLIELPSAIKLCEQSLVSSDPTVTTLGKGRRLMCPPLDKEPVQLSFEIMTPTGVPVENILYLGGPNIASEIYNMEYANARICGAEKWRKPLAEFLRQPHFIVWDNGDLVTHEVMGGLKNAYAIGAGMIAALTNESATSKSVYFAHCTSEMIFITHLLAEEPEKLAGPLLADTYVTLSKGRNAWEFQL